MGIRLGQGGGLAAELQGRERLVETLAKTKEPITAEPGNKSQVNKAITEIEAQTDALDLLSQGAGRRDLKEAADLLRDAKMMQRLELGSPELAEFLRPLLASDQPPTPTDLGIALALANRDLSPAELHFITLRLGARVSPDAARAQENERLLHEAKATSRASFESEFTFWSPKRKAYEALTFGPMGLSIGLSATLQGLGLISPEIGLLAHGVSFVAGSQVGQALQQKLMLSKFGENLLEGADVHNPIALLRARAEKVSAEPDKVSVETGVARELIRQAKDRATDAKDPSLRAALDAVQAYAQQLDKAASSKNPSAAASAAATTLLEALSRKDARALHFRPVTPRELTTDELRAYETLLHTQLKGMLAVSNPAAIQILDGLENKHGVMARLHNEPGAPQTTLSAAELDMVRRAVGTTPSFAEVGVLSRFQAAGALKLTDIFGDQMKLQDGSVVKLKELESREDGGWQRKVGSWLRTFAKFGGPVVYGALILSGVGIPAALAASVLSSVGGNLVGAQLKSRGDAAQAVAGEDAAAGRPVFGTYGLALEAISQPNWLGVTDKALPGSLKAMAERVRGFAEASKSWFGKDIRNFGIYEQGQAFINAQLLGFASELERIAGGGGSAKAMREAAFAARAQLEWPTGGNPIGNNIIADLVTQNAFGEEPVGLNVYFSARGALLDRATKLLAAGPNEELSNANLLEPARVMLQAFARMPKKVRKEVTRDPFAEVTGLAQKPSRGISGKQLFELAQDIVNNPYAPLDRERLAPFAEAAALFAQASRSQWDRLGSVDAERAREVAQETVALLWTTAHTILGTVSADQASEPPEFRKASATAQTQDGRLTGYKVQGELKGGGRLEIDVRPNGVPVWESITLDLGEARLGAMAKEAIRSYIASTGRGDATALGDPENLTPKREGEANYRFRVAAGNRTYEIEISPYGFAKLDSLK